MYWYIEFEVFGENERVLAEVLRCRGHKVLSFEDGQLEEGRISPPVGQPLLFRGSLENARRFSEDPSFAPGAFCAVEAFACHSWYPAAENYLLPVQRMQTTVRQLCSAPERFSQLADSSAKVFVRPDSCLKPFAGRVVGLEGLKPADLDHGFYYEQLDLPIWVSQTAVLGAEYRFVVVNCRIVAGSVYEALDRKGQREYSAGPAWDFGACVAESLPAPEEVYVLDVVQSEGSFYLLELNPFSGADLYACDPQLWVRALENHLAESQNRQKMPQARSKASIMR